MKNINNEEYFEKIPGLKIEKKERATAVMTHGLGQHYI